MPRDDQIFPYLKSDHMKRGAAPVLEVLPNRLWMHKTKMGHVNVAVSNSTNNITWISLHDKGTIGPSVEALKALRDACSYALQEYYGVKTVSIDEPKLKAEDKPTAESTVIRIYSWDGDDDLGWVAVKTKSGWRVSCDSTAVYDDEVFWRNCKAWDVIHSQEAHYRTY